MFNLLKWHEIMNNDMTWWHPKWTTTDPPRSSDLLNDWLTTRLTPTHHLLLRRITTVPLFFNYRYYRNISIFSAWSCQKIIWRCLFKRRDHFNQNIQHESWRFEIIRIQPKILSFVTIHWILCITAPEECTGNWNLCGNSEYLNEGQLDLHSLRSLQVVSSIYPNLIANTNL